jgi:hypothetical protein
MFDLNIIPDLMVFSIIMVAYGVGMIALATTRLHAIFGVCTTTVGVVAAIGVCIIALLTL